MSLYRKYRPNVFADVYGQEHVTTTLENAIERDKLVHAYLFAGTRGTGKTSVARILAKHLMLKGIEDEVLQKQIEKGVEEGSIVDLLEIDAASNRGIDHVRDLIEKIQFSPVVAAAKVYIIDEVHMLTKESFNALLKTLEEPPKYAYFILATTEFNKIPETIKSRCQCFPFRHVSEGNIIRRLQYIADQEGITVERDALSAIAHMSDGGMRDAISLLDQMRSLDSITVDDVKQRIGSTGKEYVEEILDAIERNDTEKIVKCIKQVEEAGVPMDVFAKQLLSELREMLHVRIKKGQPTDVVLKRMNTVLDAIKDIRVNPVPALSLEGALLSMCGESSGGLKSSKDNQPAKPIQPSEPAPEPEPEPAPISEPQPEPEPVPEQKAAPTNVTLETVQNSWQSIVNEAQPASVKMSLKNGRVTALNENRIQISFSSAFHKDKVANANASRAVEEVLLKTLGAKLTLECTVEGGGGDAPVIKSEPEKQDDEIVSLADAAAEIF